MRTMIEKISNALFGLRNRHFIVIDAIAFAITPLLALALRLDKFNVVKIINSYGFELLVATTVFLVIKLSVLYGFGLDRKSVV